MNFPNYRSLESQIAQNFQGLSRELAGEKILDNRNVSASAALDGPVAENLILEGNLHFTYSAFSDQHVVDASGELSRPTREDLSTIVGAGVKLPFEHSSRLRTLASFSVQGIFNTSNQNSFDAQRTHFTPLYYNFHELRLTPGAKVFFGRSRNPVALSISTSYARRSYPHRQVQDGTGVYQPETLNTQTWMSAISLSYPMAEHFSLLFNVQHGRAYSNQRFEQFYRYNYLVTNYLFGFNFSY